MILEFDNSVLNDVNNADLARAVGMIYDRGHKIEKNPTFRQYLVENIINRSYFGATKIDKIRSSIATRNITDFERSCYQTIKVGKGQGMVGLSDLLVVLSCANYLVLENANYDFCVIRRWVDYFKNDITFQDVNSSVLAALDNGNILPYNAGGGNGTIVNAMKVLVPVCGRYPQYKLMTIYDSDKTSTTDATDHNHALHEYLHNTGITGYELHKREIENYFTCDAFDEAGFALADYTLIGMAADDLDYADMEHSVNGYKKKYMPRLCQYMQKGRLVQRVNHHLVAHPEFGDITEIQSIILLMAKLI